MAAEERVGVAVDTEVHERPGDEIVADLPPTENKRFYPALDGLRAVAALMVFVQHYMWNLRVLNWGWSGVDIFFVLSGFLITGILYDTRNAKGRFTSFYARRSLRIFPLYYAVLLVIFALTPLVHWQWHISGLLWPLYLSNYTRFIWLRQWMADPVLLDHLRSFPQFKHHMLLRLGHLWSLAVEEQFYLVWPLCVFAVRDRVRLRNLCLLFCVICPAARVLCGLLVPAPYLNAELLYRSTPLRVDALLLGGAIALMLRGPEAEWLRRVARPALLILFSCFVVFELVFLAIQRHPYAPGTDPYLPTLGYSLVDLFAGLLILRILEPVGLLYRALMWRPLRSVGQVSYGFYLFHDIPHTFYVQVLWHISPSRPDSRPFILQTAILGLICTLLLAFASFRFFEAPFLRLKSRFAVRPA